MSGPALVLVPRRVSGGFSGWTSLKESWPALACCGILLHQMGINVDTRDWCWSIQLYWKIFVAEEWGTRTLRIYANMVSELTWRFFPTTGLAHHHMPCPSWTVIPNHLLDRGQRQCQVLKYGINSFDFTVHPDIHTEANCLIIVVDWCSCMPHCPCKRGGSHKPAIRQAKAKPLQSAPNHSLWGSFQMV